MAHMATLPPGYSVSKDGKVYSSVGWRGHATRELAQFPHSDGYLSVRVTREGGKRVRLMVHRLVAEYFIGRRPSLAHEVRHLDGNKLNNHFSNLAWGTKKENAHDREEHGRTSRGHLHSQSIKNGISKAKLRRAQYV